MTSTQDTSNVNESPARAKKQLWIDPRVHEALRRRVAVERAMGREESMNSLSSKLLARALDKLPDLPHIPPAA